MLSNSLASASTPWTGTRAHWSRRSCKGETGPATRQDHRGKTTEQTVWKIGTSGFGWNEKAAQGNGGGMCEGSQNPPQLPVPELNNALPSHHRIVAPDCVGDCAAQGFIC